jgi:hypothetical protein
MLLHGLVHHPILVKVLPKSWVDEFFLQIGMDLKLFDRGGGNVRLLCTVGGFEV